MEKKKQDSVPKVFEAKDTINGSQHCFFYIKGLMKVSSFVS